MQFVELIFWLFKYFNVLLAVHIVLESLKFNYSFRTKGTPNMQLFRILRFGSFVCFSWWNPSLLTWRYEIYWCFISKNYILLFSFLILFTKFKSAFLIYFIVSENNLGSLPFEASFNKKSWNCRSVNLQAKFII